MNGCEITHSRISSRSTPSVRAIKLSTSSREVHRSTSNVMHGKGPPRFAGVLVLRFFSPGEECPSEPVAAAKGASPGWFREVSDRETGVGAETECHNGGL